MLSTSLYVHCVAWWFQRFVQDTIAFFAKFDHLFQTVGYVGNISYNMCTGCLGAYLNTEDTLVISYTHTVYNRTVHIRIGECSIATRKEDIQITV